MKTKLSAVRSVVGISIALVVCLSVGLAPSAWSQDGTDGVRPAPRWPDGRISFTAPPGEVGNWDGPVGTNLFEHTRKFENDVRGFNLQTNLHIDDVPFQPWSRALYEYRQATFTKDDPHTRCRPSGGARMFHTPYGFEIIERPESQEVIFLSVGAPHSWRIVYMDGRPHPEDPRPTWYGHSVGHWEGDTLVIDTVGFNERFWLTRTGVPHTSQLHLTERISRPSFHRLRYEVTVDDPGAYAEPWTGGWYMPWGDGNEPFDYLCQENNLDAARMVGPELAAQ